MEPWNQARSHAWSQAWSTDMSQASGLVPRREADSERARPQPHPPPPALSRLPALFPHPARPRYFMSSPPDYIPRPAADRRCPARLAGGPVLRRRRKAAPT